MAGSTTKYTNLITSEHQSAPKFMDMVAQVCQAWADSVALSQLIPGLYDIDQAVGAQLDVIGRWVGISRQLSAPLVGIYFSFDTAGVGFDQGVWLGPYDPTTGLVSLPDDQYRLLLKAKILNNHWDCDTADAYALANVIFQPLGYQLFIQDHGDLTMDLGLIGSGPPPPIVWSMLTTGSLNIKPLGVHINNYVAQSSAGPIFAFDINNTSFAGFDVGSWATIQAN